MPREEYREKIIKDQRYRIGLMDAYAGSWVSMQLLTKLFPVNIEAMLNLNPASMPANRTEISEHDFLTIQRHCLRVVSRLDSVGNQTAAIPILMANGDFAVKELKHDVVAVLTLTAESLVFNVGPFFEDGALKSLLESLSGLSQFASPTL